MPRCVLTLIAAEPAQDKLASAATVAGRALVRLGAQVQEADWLAPAGACDIAFDGLDPDQADAAARSALAGAFGPLALDLVAQEAAGRRKRLLVADMESTIIANEMLDEIGDLVGLGERISEITRRAMNDEIDFAAALTERVALLKDQPASLLEEARRRIRVTPGAAALVATMRANGAYAALVSGGFRSYTEPVGAALGFDVAIANEIEIADGKLTGTVRQPILTRDTKLATLKRLAAERGLPLSQTLAVGDGANDLPMIEAAGLGIAYHGKPAVTARARLRIDHADLTALLYAQGYRQAEIVPGAQL
ncbi:MAG TPA: phosphoserine phosphatase SerB [Stellaceae bacterium]|nr:phosphoserine phosphatase SerB [Stellaceae bacterium]